MNASQQSSFMTAWARPCTIVSLILAAIITWRGECWAYIDPNAGGAVAQIIAPLMAIVLSFFFYCRKEIKKFIQSVRARIKRIDSAGDARESSPSPDRQ
jgi:hypothetical protein